MTKFNKTKDGYLLTAVPDTIDFRDRYYSPALLTLAAEIKRPVNAKILDQGAEGACTGFGLAAVINHLNAMQSNPLQVSARMLYEMARRFDEWPGEAYEGSSCRGAITGWYHMGVCSEEKWPYHVNESSSFTLDKAKDARSNTIGAYYRVQKNIVDMHAALNEVGVLYVSANVHSGWYSDNIVNGRIPYRDESIGGHAFAIVGYNTEGFWVQNSWGSNWGDDGFALWSYEDWIKNVSDAWVVRLALPTPQIFHLAHQSKSAANGTAQLPSPRRSEIAGHFVHIDDGHFHTLGKYWSTLEDVAETAQFVANSADYDHILFYAHGGLNTPDGSASRISAMKNVFKANRIYPFHFMYETGLAESIKDIITGRFNDTKERALGLSDVTDLLIERSASRVGRKIWDEMKRDASLPFKNETMAGVAVISSFMSALAGSGKTKAIHLVGHSAGSILLAHWLKQYSSKQYAQKIASCSLMAPACTTKLFDSHFVPLLTGGGSGLLELMQVYNLSDQLELDDHVAIVYRKSLLYLVSNAFEQLKAEPLLGMEKFSRAYHDTVKIHYSDGPRHGNQTQSTSHGGFDNDPATMNSILATVLGKPPLVPFTAENLKY